MQGLGPAINDYIAAIFTASQPSSTPAERAASLAVLNQVGEHSLAEHLKQLTTRQENPTEAP